MDLGQGEGTRCSSSVLVVAKTGGHLKEQVVLTSYFRWGKACLGGGGENESVKENLGENEELVLCF